jgi:hypothetical protein
MIIDGIRIIKINFNDFMAFSFKGILCDPSTNKDLETAPGIWNNKLAIVKAI